MNQLKAIPAIICIYSTVLSTSAYSNTSTHCEKALLASKTHSGTNTSRTAQVNAEILKKAIIFAKRKHAGQVRKFSGRPYISHPVQVLKILKMYTDDIEVLVAALLHDVIEDTDTSFKELALNFGRPVALLVDGLTSDKEMITTLGKTEYLTQKMQAMDLRTLLIKLADRLHNTSDFQDANPKFNSKYRAETNHILALLGNRTDLQFAHYELIGNIYSAMLEGEKAYRGRIFSEKKYEGLKRKFTLENYSVHPSRVAKTLKRLKASVDIQIAGYLKDSMEKGEGTTYNEIRDQFGITVANIVQELTVDPLYRAHAESREQYETDRALRLSDGALLIRLTGRLDNIKEIFENETHQYFVDYLKETKGMLTALENSQRLLTPETTYIISKIKYLLYRSSKR